MQRKHPFYSHAKAGLSDRYGLANSGVFSGDYDSLEYLNSFLVAFFDFHVNADRITGLKLRDIIAKLPSFNVFNYWIHVYYLFINLCSSPGYNGPAPLTRSHAASLGVRPLEKIGTALKRLFNGLTAPPTLDLCMIAAQQYFGNLEPTVVRRPGVLRVIEQPMPISPDRE